MLSFIYRLAHDFERSHGIRPNRLYINEHHLQELRQSLVDPADMQTLAARLGMAITIDPEAAHPRPAWHPLTQRRTG